GRRWRRGRALPLNWVECDISLMPLAGRAPDRWRVMVVARAMLRYNGHPAARVSPWGVRVSSMAHGILCWARSGAAPRARNRRPWPHMGRSTASCGVLDGPPASVRARRRGLAGHSGGCLALARAAAGVLGLPSRGGGGGGGGGVWLGLGVGGVGGEMMGHLRWRVTARGVLVCLLFGAALVAPPLSLAHPLGNFSIGHYAGLRLTREGIALRYVLDMAEI